MIVEKAASGIIEEGKTLGELDEAEQLARLLIEQKKKGMKEVWKRCVHLYTAENFLYKNLNGAMRLIGHEECEDVWRSKIRTLGPFCLLLWDSPFNNRPNRGKQLLYRGVGLSDELITSFKDLSQHPNKIHSFQAFSSSTRNFDVAQIYGNAIFVMEVKYAYTMDVSPFSKYSVEEEELVYPGVCFTVQRVEFDSTIDKHLIYLQLQHRFIGEYDLCEKFLLDDQQGVTL
jgi:hypothetical protein